MSFVIWNYNSGLPYRQILGYYNKYDPTGILNPTSSLTDYFYYPSMAERNAARLPGYHRMDLSLSKKIEVWGMQLSVDANVMNVYDRKNFFYFDEKTGDRINMLPFLPSVDVKVDL